MDSRASHVSSRQRRRLAWLFVLVLLAAAGTACDDGTGPTVASPDTGADTLAQDTVTPDAAQGDEGPTDSDNTPDESADLPVDAAVDTTIDAGPEVIAGACPPPGPYGHAAGTQLTNYTLTRCDGSTIDVHDLCGSVGLIFNFYGW